MSCRCTGTVEHTYVCVWKLLRHGRLSCTPVGWAHKVCSPQGRAMVDVWADTRYPTNDCNDTSDSHIGIIATDSQPISYTQQYITIIECPQSLIYDFYNLPFIVTSTIKKELAAGAKQLDFWQLSSADFDTCRNRTGSFLYTTHNTLPSSQICKDLNITA